jgi:hypothetical protein
MMSTSHYSDPLLPAEHTAEPTDNTALHYAQHSATTTHNTSFQVHSEPLAHTQKFGRVPPQNGEYPRNPAAYSLITTTCTIGGGVLVLVRPLYRV